MTLQAVRNIFSSYCLPEDKLVLAISGGPDSMCLLHICQRLFPAEKLIIAHFNHCMRKESKHEALFVKKYCQQNKLTYEYAEKDIPRLARRNKKSLEEMARQQRYAFLEKVKTTYRASFIVTAHHLDDNVETILLHIIRGTGLHGLVGMREYNKGILRPLLSFPKKKIVAYCKRYAIQYCTDKTNFQPITSRNIVRLQIMPLIQHINPHFSKTLIRTATQMKDIEEYLKDRARMFLR